MIEIENVIILQKEKGRFDKFCPISKFKDLPEAGDMFEDMMEIAKSIHSSIKLQTDEPVEILIQDNNYLVSCVSYQGELKEFEKKMFDSTERARDYIYSLGFEAYTYIQVGIQETN
jgi:hypothetical protein